MVSQESKELILQFIRSADKPTKNDVIKYMASAKVREKDFRTSRMTTIKLINELEASGRIKVLRGDGWRQGQPHYLITNDTSHFIQITEQFTNIESFLHAHPETEERCLNLVVWNLARVDKYIKNENDKQWLNQKGLDLLLRIRYKTKEEGLSSKV